MTQARISEISTVATNILVAYKKTTWENDPSIVTIFTELETESDELTIAINRGKSESVLADLDSECDYYSRALNYVVEGATFHPDNTVKVAGTKLYEVFDKYGLEMIQESYAVENALIISLLEDLAKPELKDYITAISGCSEIIVKLKQAQINFENALVDWKEEKAQKKNLQSATEIKRTVHSIINKKVIPYLSAMQQVNPTVYGKLAQTINQVIIDMNSDIKQRNKKPEPENATK